MTFEMHPIAFVHNARVTKEDDYWGGVESRIVLTAAVDAESILGLDEFSHAEILFVFHDSDPAKIVRGARHPRNNPAWPKVGIFAQRGKWRPNLIGSTIVRIIRCEPGAVFVSELDAIHGTPVLDIKPIMSEFLPREPVRQPAWTRDVMENYWQGKGAS